MKFNRRQGLAALAAVGLPPAAWSQTLSTPPATLPAPPNAPGEVPLASFFAQGMLADAELSPDGRRVALCVRKPGERLRLMLVDLTTLAPTMVDDADAPDVVWVHWLGNDKLVFLLEKVYEEEEDLDSDEWKRRRAWSRRVGGGYVVYDIAANTMRALEGNSATRMYFPRNGNCVLKAFAQDTSEGAGFYGLRRYELATKQRDELDVPPWSQDFLIDAKGDVVAAITSRKNTSRLMWKDGDGWRVVREFERYFGEDFSLSDIAPDGTIYVTARNGGDQSALYSFDPITNKLSDKPLLKVAQFDLAPRLIYRNDKLVGVRVLADAYTTVWFDDEIKALQAKIDAKLPDTANVVSLPKKGDSPWVLVWAYSDRQPAVAMVYQRETGKLLSLSQTRPDIDPKLMSLMDYLPYKARDGRTIPSYLTLPKGAGTRRPLPMVVLVHGGPFARGASWRWDAEVQFLASRGYAVLQPEFRGSTGFGRDHFTAGWKQWGQAMQDDLVDGAKWAIAQGIADPKRIAIAGASYGGYAAMMGLAKNANVFACAVNWIGVTDLDLLYGAHWSDQPGVYKEHGIPKILGDRKADAEMLRANSPIHLAKQITKPVLMAYGKKDLRVPIEHGERMRDALKGHNPNVEWVLYDNEGHGWRWKKNTLDFWGRVERFLDRYLKA